MNSNNPLKAQIAAPLTEGETYSVRATRKNRRSQRPWDTKGAPFDPAKVTRNPGTLTAAR